MNLSKIHHIAIIVSDYEAAKDFYGVIGVIGSWGHGVIGVSPPYDFLKFPDKV